MMSVTAGNEHAEQYKKSCTYKLHFNFSLIKDDLAELISRAYQYV